MRLKRIKCVALLSLLLLCAALGAVPAYAADESVTVTFPVYATGAACNAVLKNKDGAVVANAAVPADGSANFTIECAGLGTHSFTLSLNNVDAGPIAYDKTVYDIRINLFYNDDFEIIYTVEARDPSVIIVNGDAKIGKLEFVNEVGYKPCKTDPPVRKVVKGSPPVNSTFTFELRASNADNHPMPNGSTNGVKQISITGAGEAEFGDITYTEPGTYNYTVKEIIGDAAGYTYDTTIYTLRIVVTAEADRLLASNYKYYVNGQAVDMAEATFTNTYTDPKGKPKTGDESNPGLWLALAGGSLLVLLVLLFFLKRRKKDEQPPKVNSRPKG